MGGFIVTETSVSQTLMCKLGPTWANDNQVQWYFHLPYSTTGSGLIERKDKL
jgi:hypothetical protein